MYLIRGQRYRFVNNSGGSHPFQIRFNDAGNAYTDGVTYPNGATSASSGNIEFNVQHDAPDLLFYQCTSHGGMVGRIVIVGDVVKTFTWTGAEGTAQTIDTITGISNNNVKTLEYTLVIQKGSDLQAQKLLVLSDGTNTYDNEYSATNSSGYLAAMSSTISGGNLLVQATPDFGVNGSMTITFSRKTIR